MAQKTIEESLAMAETPSPTALRHVVATPHASSEYNFDFARPFAPPG